MQDFIPRTIDINDKIKAIAVKQFDNNSRFLHVQILDRDKGDGLFDLTGCSASLYIQPEGCDDPSQVAYVQGEVSEDDSGNSIATFLLPGGVTQNAGRFECEIYINEGDSSHHPVISTKPFTMTVEKSIRNDQAVMASSQYSALDAWAASVQSIDSRMNTLESMADEGEIPAGTLENEVLAARVGWDGTAYDNLGAAVRGQVSQIRTSLTQSVADMEEALFRDDDLSIGTVTQGAILKDDGSTTLEDTRFSYCLAEVAVGNVLSVTGQGQTSTHYPIGLLFDENMNVLDRVKPGDNARYTDLAYTVETAGAKYFAVNSNNNVAARIIKKIKVGIVETEVADAREGWDGSSYSTLGAAVRGQISGVHASLSQSISAIEAEIFTEDYADVGTLVTGSILKDDGSTTLENASYSYCIAEVSPGDRLLFTGQGQISTHFPIGMLFDLNMNMLDSVRPGDNARYTDLAYTVESAGAKFFAVNSNNNVSARIRKNVKVSKLAKASVIDIVGDSLSIGNSDNSGVSIGSVLAKRLGNDWKINLLAAGGEQSNTIAARQGGLALMARTPFTIPASSSEAVYVPVTDNEGNAVNLRNSLTYLNIVNPCYINGIKGVLSYETIGASPYKFTRSESGEAVTVSRDCQIVTDQMRHTGHILIVWIGTNGGYSQSASELVKQIRFMVDYNRSDRYLILGVHRDSQYTASAADVNTALYAAFGRHFINYHEYITHPVYDGNNNVTSCWGLEDNRLTATAQDLSDLGNAKIPDSLRVDATHFNQYGYTVIGNLIYGRGRDLGYW